MSIDPVCLGDRLEPVANVGYRLGRAEKQNAALSEGKIKLKENFLLSFRAQVNEKIATGD